MPTIDCDEFCRFIDVYLDDELEPQDRAEFDAHLARCSKCRRQADQQIWFRRGVRDHMKRPPHGHQLPQEARARIRNKLRGSSRPSRVTRIARTMAVPVVASGALLLFVTPLTGFTSVVDYDECVEQHHKRAPVEVPSPEAEEIDDWFRDKLQFRMLAPRFRDHRVTLLGGRLSRVGTRNNVLSPRDAAYLVYGVGSHKMTILVFEGRDVELSNGGRVRSLNGRPVTMHDMGDMRVAVFKRHKLAYAVTSPLPEPELLQIVASAF